MKKKFAAIIISTAMVFSLATFPMETFAKNTSSIQTAQVKVGDSVTKEGNYLYSDGKKYIKCYINYGQYSSNGLNTDIDSKLKTFEGYDGKWISCEEPLQFTLSAKENYSNEGYCINYGDYKIPDSNGLCYYTITDEDKELNITFYVEADYTTDSGVLTFKDSELGKKYLLSFAMESGITFDGIIYGSGGNSTEVSTSHGTEYYLQTGAPSIFMFGTEKELKAEDYSLEPADAGTIEIIPQSTNAIAVNLTKPATLHVGKKKETTLPPTTQTTQTTQQTTQTTDVKVGVAATSGTTNLSVTKTGEVSVTGTTNKTMKSFTIAAAYSVENQQHKVTSIKANAFKNCKQLKKITIKSTTITSVGKNALKGTAKNLVIKVPKSKKKAYTKLFKGKGNTTVKIK